VGLLLLDASVAVQVELGLAACSSGVGDDHAGAMAITDCRESYAHKSSHKSAHGTRLASSHHSFALGGWLAMAC
jgi:hypothetical protein